LFYSAIPPGYSLQYEFNITQNGTYWVHSHYETQYMDGLRFPMIINDPEIPYEYDEELVISLSGRVFVLLQDTLAYVLF
jgi:iron transport multicopper oxidase